MAENAGGGGGRRNRSTKRRGPGGGKPLSKLALSAIDKNQALVEDWLDDLEAGEVEEDIFMAKVIKQYGLEFDVQAPGQAPRRATVRGLFRAKGAFKNPGATTAVRVGNWVLVNEGGLGHMAAGTAATIVGVMTAEQASRAKRFMGMRGSSGRSSSGNVFEFNRDMANAEARAQHEAEIAAHRRNLASRRRTAVTRRRSSSNRTARSSESNASTEPNWKALSDEKKAEAKHAKLTRRKERRRAKKAAGSGWFGWF